MSSLSLDDIANLLGNNTIRPKPRQVGPLKYHSADLPNPCIVCSTSCLITVYGRPYCTTHALYALNATAVGLAIPNDCTCEAGSKTMYSLHTADCFVYDKLPE